MKSVFIIFNQATKKYIPLLDELPKTEVFK